MKDNYWLGTFFGAKVLGMFIIKKRNGWKKHYNCMFDKKDVEKVVTTLVKPSMKIPVIDPIKAEFEEKDIGLSKHKHMYVEIDRIEIKLFYKER